MRLDSSWHRRFIVLIVLLVSLAVVVFLSALGLPRRAAAADNGPPSIPGPEVIIRAIPNTGPGWFVPPPSPEKRLSPNAPQAATINVTYNGFPAQAQTAFQYAVDIWAGLLDSSVTINITATWTSLGSGVLGSAGAVNLYRDFYGAPAANTWFPNALADKWACGNVGGGAYDIRANFNSAFASWYFGTDGIVPAGQYDFATVVLHEIGHGLGFSGSATTSGGVGYWDYGGSTYPNMYTRFVSDGGGTPIINYANGSALLLTVLQGGASGLFWTGSFGTAGNSGIQPILYSPNPWESGSSFSHFDQATYASELMKPALPSGVAIHDPGARTLGGLRDVGWGDELVIQAYGYNTTGGVEWVQIKNNASISVNLSDFAIGDEENPGTGGEGMFMLPNVELAPGSLLTMRERSDGDWTTAYPGDPDPTYCWNCTSGYTNLINYSLWGGSSGNLNDTGDELVLVRTNGGTADPDGVGDDFIVDAICYGSGQPYIDTDTVGSIDGREKYIFTDATCLSLLPSGSFQRDSTVETCVPSSDLIDNPTAITLKSFEAVPVTTEPEGVFEVWPLLALGVMLSSGLLLYRHLAARLLAGIRRVK